MSRPRRAAGLALAVGVLLVLAVPATADAHARLLRAFPTTGTVLQAAGPLVFTFNERVEGSFASIRVYNTEGQEVEVGQPFRPENVRNGLAMALQPNLPQGTYRAVFRLISVDSHPVTGSIDFSIGRPSSGTFTALPQEGDTGGVTQALFWLVRWLGYAAIGLAVGGLFFLVWAWLPALTRSRAASDGTKPLRCSAGGYACCSGRPSSRESPPASCRCRSRARRAAGSRSGTRCTGP